MAKIAKYNPRTNHLPRHRVKSVVSVANRVANAYKAYKSFTKTKTKEKNSSSGEGLTSSSLTHSSCYVTRGVKVPKSVKGKVCFVSFCTGINIDSTAGDGNGNVIAAEGSVSQAMVNGGAGQNYATFPYVAPSCYNALMTDTILTGSSLFPQINRPNNQKMFNMTLGLEVHMANFSTVDAVVQLYVFESRNDSTRTVEEFINLQLIRLGGGLIGSGQPGAGSSTGGAIGFYNDSNIVGDPSKIPGMSKEYKLLKKLRFDLSSGSTHEQEFMIKMNLLHDQSLYISKNSALNNDPVSWTNANIVEMKYPKGMIHVYAFQRGCVINDVTGGANTPTYATSKIGYLIKKNLTFHSVEMKETRSAPQIRYHQNSFNPSDANQKFINVVDTSANVGKV